MTTTSLAYAIALCGSGQTMRAVVCDNHQSSLCNSSVRQWTETLRAARVTTTSLAFAIALCDSGHTDNASCSVTTTSLAYAIALCDSGQNASCTCVITSAGVSSCSLSARRLQCVCVHPASFALLIRRLRALNAESTRVLFAVVSVRVYH